MPNQLELFTCPRVKTLTLNKSACAKLYANQQERKTASSFLSPEPICYGCKTGKKNYWFFNPKKANEKKNILTKTCQLFETHPERCISSNTKGVFSKDRRQSMATWETRIFCSVRCRIRWNTIKNQEWKAAK